ncbi:hypothetical protein ZWY2020_010668 [Hordeum vulgare]|nr:hypothetical protein ZWY2020_010668 [Hordeum vulgare]
MPGPGRPQVACTARQLRPASEPCLSLAHTARRLRLQSTCRVVCPVAAVRLTGSSAAPACPLPFRAGSTPASIVPPSFDPACPPRPCVVWMRLRDGAFLDSKLPMPLDLASSLEESRNGFEQDESRDGADPASLTTLPNLLLARPHHATRAPVRGFARTEAAPPLCAAWLPVGSALPVLLHDAPSAPSSTGFARPRPCSAPSSGAPATVFAPACPGHPPCCLSSTPASALREYRSAPAPICQPRLTPQLAVPTPPCHAQPSSGSHRLASAAAPAPYRARRLAALRWPVPAGLGRLLLLPNCHGHRSMRKEGLCEPARKEREWAAGKKRRTRPHKNTPSVT